MTKEEIDELTKQHNEAPHLRILQKALARDVTTVVHSEEDYNVAVEASSILFGKGTTETLRKLSEEMLLSVFEGVPQSNVLRIDVEEGVPIVELLAEKTNIFASKGEARRMLKDNGVAVNKVKVREDFVVDTGCLLNDRYVLVQKGKKNYFLVKAVD